MNGRHNIIKEGVVLAVAALLFALFGSSGMVTFFFAFPMIPLYPGGRAVCAFYF
jgi:hypothetical protein